MVNRASEYGVVVQPLANQTQPHWRVELVTHLSPSENRGKHNVFVDAVADGQRAADGRLRIGWTWEGRQPNQAAPPKLLDKPDGEWGHGNVDMYANQTLTVWIEGDGLLSDRVTGLHTRHPDELGPNGETWNSYGHHSFFVRFVRVAGTVAPPVDPPLQPGDHEERIARLEGAIEAALRVLRELTDRLS